MTDIAPPAQAVPLERLETQITEWSGHIAAATATLLGWIADYDRREGWRSWGCKSAAHWLSWKCGDGLHAAREKVRTARALDDLPVLAASFARGELSFTKVRAITRVATPADEGEWVDMARTSTGAQLERVVAQARAAVDRDENRDARVAFERRGVARSTGSDGLDELTTTGPSSVAELKDGKVTTFEVTPEDAGLPRAAAEDIKGGEAEFNANAMRAMLSGAAGAYRDIVCYTAGASLIVADKAADLKQGAALAATAIDSGKAQAALDRMVEITNEPVEGTAE